MDEQLSNIQVINSAIWPLSIAEYYLSEQEIEIKFTQDGKYCSVLCEQGMLIINLQKQTMICLKEYEKWQFTTNCKFSIFTPRESKSKQQGKLLDLESFQIVSFFEDNYYEKFYEGNLQVPIIVYHTTKLFTTVFLFKDPLIKPIRMFQIPNDLDFIRIDFIFSNRFILLQNKNKLIIRDIYKYKIYKILKCNVNTIRNQYLINDQIIIIQHNRKIILRQLNNNKLIISRRIPYTNICQIIKGQISYIWIGMTTINDDSEETDCLTNVIVLSILPILDNVDKQVKLPEDISYGAIINEKQIGLVENDNLQCTIFQI